MLAAAVYNTFTLVIAVMITAAHMYSLLLLLSTSFCPLSCSFTMSGIDITGGMNDTTLHHTTPHYMRY